MVKLVKFLNHLIKRTCVEASERRKGLRLWLRVFWLTLSRVRRLQSNFRIFKVIIFDDVGR